MNKRGARGQIELSFGMIFSIILIIAFLVFAFYGIRTFLRIQDDAKIASFVKDFQTDVDNSWKSEQSSDIKEYFLPSKVSMVCFADMSNGTQKRGQNSAVYDNIKRFYTGYENLFFYPAEPLSTKSVEINNIDLANITSQENPFCISADNEKVSIRIVKDFGSTEVKIFRG